MNHFSNLLDALLNDVSGEETIPELENLSNEYMQTIQKIDRIKNQLEELFNDLDIIKKKTLTNLATASKSQQPEINVSLDDTLTIGDNSQQCEVTSPTQCSIGQETQKFESPLELTDFVLNVFVPECKNGSNKIFIEGKKANTLKLYARKESLYAL